MSFIVAYENEFGVIDALVNKRGGFLQFYSREKAEEFVKDNYNEICKIAGVEELNYEVRLFHSDLELGKYFNVWRGF